MLEYDKDGNLVVEVVPQTQQFSGQVGLVSQVNTMNPQNRPNSGAQFLIGIIFPWILFGGFAILSGLSQAILYEQDDGGDYYEEDPYVVLAVGNGQNTEFSGVDNELVTVDHICEGGINIYNWYPPPDPYTTQWIEIGELTQNYHGSYTECSGRDESTLWLFREKSDGTTDITEVGQINKNNDGGFELSFDSAPPESAKIEYYWYDYDYDDDMMVMQELIMMACCTLPVITYIGAIVVGYAKGFVAFSNGALIGTVGSVAIFFIGCMAVLMTMGF